MRVKPAHDGIEALIHAAATAAIEQKIAASGGEVLEAAGVAVRSRAANAGELRDQASAIIKPVRTATAGPITGAPNAAAARR